MRDDFDKKTKITLAQRVGFKCSNPNCRKLTTGPQEKITKSINIGVAAHISGADKGGARYNPNLSSVERKSIENGIWLCQNCAKLIDSDEKRYDIDLLLEWKKLSEQAALLEIEKNITSVVEGDQEIIKSFAQCFDRPAFEDPFRQEGSMEAFYKAIEDTIIAINTGTLRTRDGTILHKSYGKAFLNNPLLKQNMDVIVDLLRAIRERFTLAVKNKEINVGRLYYKNQSYCFNNMELCAWFDLTRNEILTIFEKVCKIAGVNWQKNFPRWRKFW